MIKFVYENEEFGMRFMYVNGLENIPGVGLKRQHSTIAQIFKGRDTAPLFEGRATCYYKDRFDKETGRKMALKYALSDCAVKTFRRTVWMEYHLRGVVGPYVPTEVAKSELSAAASASAR